MYGHTNKGGGVGEGVGEMMLIVDGGCGLKMKAVKDDVVCDIVEDGCGPGDVRGGDDVEVVSTGTVIMMFSKRY